MVFDGHIHISAGEVDSNSFQKKLTDSGVDGGVLISLPPNSFFMGQKLHTPEERLDNLFSWQGNNKNLYPFFWVDPVENDALEQVELADLKGVSGFKIICNRFYPDDSRAMNVYRLIASKRKPILFHSGILWDGHDSSKYNRPGMFEALLEVEGLKFSLAHVSWPWYDECIAVYGKFLNAYANRSGLSVEMFIDITPGTPPIYREEVLTKLFTVGYDIENNIIFGSDCFTNDYNISWVRQWKDRDDGIYKRIGLTEKNIDRIYSKNLERFLGISMENDVRTPMRQGM